MIEYTIQGIIALEPYIEVINLIFSLIVVVFGFMSLRFLVGRLKEVWAYFLIAIFLFGVHEIFGSLESFGVFSVSGVYEITELLFIVGFFVSAVIFKNLLNDISDKKGSRNK